MCGIALKVVLSNNMCIVDTKTRLGIRLVWKGVGEEEDGRLTTRMADCSESFLLILAYSMVPFYLRSIKYSRTILHSTSAPDNKGLGLFRDDFCYISETVLLRGNNICFH